MKQALFITPVVPDASGAGRAKRAYQWVLQLRNDYQVEVLLVQGHSAGTSGDMLQISPPVSKMIVRSKKDKVSVVKNSIFSARRFLSLSSLFVPGWVGVNEKLSVDLKEWLNDKKFHKIICFRLTNAELALHLRSEETTVELDMDDLESATWSSIARLYRKNGEYRKWLRTWFISGQYSRLENYFIARFSKTHVCSEEDQRTLNGRFPGRQIAVMPNKLDHVTDPPAPSFHKMLLFVGSLAYYPNQEAVLWFAGQVLPLLRKKDPDWCFKVVGFSPPWHLKQRLAKMEGVVVCENLRSIREAYSSSFALVSPLHAGGGTKLKVIEAMMYQRPVIATEESVRGLALRKNTHYLPAETALEFLEHILSLHQDKQRYGALTETAAIYAREHYSYADDVIFIG